MKEELHTRSVWHRFTASFMAMLMLLSILTTMPVMAANVKSIQFVNSTDSTILINNKTSSYTGNLSIDGTECSFNNWTLQPTSGGSFDSVISFTITSKISNVEAVITDTVTNREIERFPLALSQSGSTYKGTLELVLEFYDDNVENIKVEFRPVKKVYTVSLTASDGIEIKDKNPGKNDVDENQQFQFKAVVDAGQKVTATKYDDRGYVIGTLLADSVDKESTPGKWEYSYRIDKVEANMEIRLSKTTETYTVTVNGLDGDGFTTSLGKLSTYSVSKSYNADFSFTLTPDEGYDPPTVTATQGNTINKSGNVYTIPHVTQDTTITITSANKKKHTVSYQTSGDGFTATAKAEGSEAADGTIEVEHDKELTYTVTVDEAHSKSKPTVTANGKTFKGENQGDGNVYTFTIPITGETNITVSGLTLNKYTVTYEKSGESEKKFTTDLLDSQTVEHGKSIEFNLTVDDGYETPTVRFVETESGSDISDAVITNVGGKVTIRNVTKDGKIVITDGKVKTYTVTKPTSNKYTVEVTKNGENAGESVSYGDGLTIKVTLNDAYSKSNPTVYVNSAPVNGTKDDKVYTCENYTVTGNVNIVVQGVDNKNTYTVNLPGNGNGYTIQSTGGNTVTHDGSLSFTVTVAENYKFANEKNENDLIKVEGTDTQNVKIEKKDDAGKIYEVTIRNVTSDGISVTIDSNCLEKIVYSITFASAGTSGPVQGSAYDIETPGGTKVEFKNVGYSFSVKPKPGYKVTGVIYNSGNSKGISLPQNSDSTPSKANYSIASVIDNVEFIISVAPITVTVDYQWDDIVFGGATIAGGHETVTYTKDGPKTYNISGEQVTIALPDASNYKGFDCDWDCEEIKFEGDDSHKDQNITVKGKFTLQSSEPGTDSDPETGGGGIPFVNATCSFLDFRTDEENGYFRWESQLSVSAEGKLAEALKESGYNVTNCGFLVSINKQLNYEITENGVTVREGTSNLTKGSIGNLNLGESNIYHHSIYYKINDLEGRDNLTFYGAFWYTLVIDGKTYVYVTNSDEYTFNSSVLNPAKAESISLDDEPAEDDEAPEDETTTATQSEEEIAND